MDVFCRVCGEPYHTTGSNHTLVDMPWWSWEQFVKGMGCPSCDGINPLDSAHDVEAAMIEQRAKDARHIASIERAFEGVEPYEGWPGPAFPTWSSFGRGQACALPRYFTVDEEPTAQFAYRLQFDGIELTPCPSKPDDPPTTQVTQIVKDNQLDVIEYWAQGHSFSSEHFDAEGTLLQQANIKALLRALENDNIPAWPTHGKGVWIPLAILVPCYNFGSAAWSWLARLRIIEDIERAMLDHPVFCDRTYDEVKAEAMEEIFDGFINENGMSVADNLHLSETVAHLLIKDCIATEGSPLYDCEPNEAGDDFVEEPEIFEVEYWLREKGYDVEPLGWYLYKSTVNKDCIVMMPKVHWEAGECESVPCLLVTWDVPNVKGTKVIWTTLLASEVDINEHFWPNIPVVVRAELVEALQSGNIEIDAIL